MKKNKKGRLDLSEIKNKSEKKKEWKDSIGSNIYYYLDDKKYIFKLIKYEPDRQMATLLYEDQEYKITTSAILNCSFGRIIGNFVKGFRYNTGDVIKTKRKDCKIVKRIRYGKNSQKHYMCKCMDCGNTKRISEGKLIDRGFTCNLCSDDISYPERLFSSVLLQLGVKYEYQKTFDWSKKVTFSCDEKPRNKIYDFYIPSIEAIIEVNGEFHYKEGKWSRSRSLEYIEANDKEKELLAKNNGIEKYISIDCMESDLDYIKNNILKSEFNNLFDLTKIDWEKCNLDSCVSLMKVCSDLWNSGIRSTSRIAKEVNLTKNTVITYLKKFSELGFNDYDPEEAIRKCARETQEKNKKKVLCLDNNMIFDSVKDCVEESGEIFGVKLNASKISDVCRGVRKHHRYYHFKYLNDLTDEERERYNIDSKAN